MPGSLLHIEFAARLVSEPTILAAIGADQNVDATLKAIAAAGAVAPDMGYAIGASRLISDASHYFRTADLARHIWNHADSCEAKVFAIGWISHWLLDTQIHPLINTLAASASNANQDSITFAEDPSLHVAVEFGLEIVKAERLVKGGAAFPDFCIPTDNQFVISAFRETYGDRISSASISHAMRRLPSWNRMANGLARSRTTTWSAKHPVLVSLRQMLDFLVSGFVRFCSPHAAICGLFAPIMPNPETEATVTAATGDCDRIFVRHLQSNFESLANSNLDTGEVEGLDNWYAPAVATRRCLASAA